MKFYYGISYKVKKYKAYFLILIHQKLFLFDKIELFMVIVHGCINKSVT